MAKGIMVSVDSTTGCCGIRDLYDLQSDSRDIILEAADCIENGLNAAFYMFADNIDEGNGIRLARYIKRHKLGKLHKTPYVLNPNSGNRMCAWMWQLDHDAISKFKESVETKQEDTYNSYPNYY